MYSAIQENDLHFNLIHEPDGSRIGYQKICKTEGEPVPDDEIVKAFELEKGEFVPITDEDLDSVKSEGVKSIDITDFVPYDDIDPIFFERTYHLGPQEGSERVYALLREAMEGSGLAAIAKYVMRDRQHLGCLRVREGVITLERMFFHDEIRPNDELAPGKVKVDKRELEMASALIEQFSGEWKPEKYEDTYREALLDLIKAKAKGKTVTPPEEPADEEPGDLLAALRASVEAAKGGGRSKPARERRAPERKKSSSRSRSKSRR
jgi:DNA end-binding protein Ku